MKNGMTESRWQGLSDRQGLRVSGGTWAGSGGAGGHGAGSGGRSLGALKDLGCLGAFRQVCGSLETPEPGLGARENFGAVFLGPCGKVWGYLGSARSLQPCCTQQGE